MHLRPSVLLLITTSILGCQGLGSARGTAAAPDPSAPIRVTTSDSEVEKQLGAYFGEVKDWTFEYEVFSSNADDVYVSVPWTTTEDGPTMNVMVDVEPSAGSKEENDLREIRIRVVAAFKWEIDAKHPLRAAALEALNAYHNDYWTPRASLDEDGDLILDASVNIPGRDFSVHPELVADVVERMSGSWSGLTALLEKHGLPMPQNF